MRLAKKWKYLTYDALGWELHTDDPYFCNARCWVCNDGKTRRTRIPRNRPKTDLWGRYYKNVWKRCGDTWKWNGRR